MYAGPLSLHDREVATLRGPRELAIVWRPFRFEVPEEAIDIHLNSESYQHWHGYVTAIFADDSLRIRQWCPFRVDGEYWVREVHRIATDPTRHAAVQFLDTEVRSCMVPPNYPEPRARSFDSGWKSPICMPKWAPRCGALCESVFAHKLSGTWYWVAQLWWMQNPPQTPAGT